MSMQRIGGQVADQQAVLSKRGPQPIVRIHPEGPTISWMSKRSPIDRLPLHPTSLSPILHPARHLIQHHINSHISQMTDKEILAQAEPHIARLRCA